MKEVIIAGTTSSKNRTTESKGKTRIMKEKIAKWAAVSVFATSLVSSALCAEELERSASAWTPIIQKEGALLKENDDPDLRAIRLGAAICIASHPGHDNW